MGEGDAIYQRAEQAFQKGQIDYAVSLFLQVLSLDPNHENAHKALVATLRRKFEAKGGGPGKFTATALAMKTAATLATVGGNPKKRMEISLGHLTQDPMNVKIRLVYAEALAEAGFLEGAVVEARMATELDAKSSAALKLYGTLARKKDLIPEAQDAYQRALKLVPEDREVGKALRDLAALDSMHKTGIDKTSTYRDMMKDKDKAADLEAVHHLIRTDEDYQKEVEKIKADIQQTPDDYRLYRKLGDLAADRKKDYKTAQAHYKKAAELNPQDSLLRDKLDECTIRMMEGRIEEMEKAKDPKIGEMRKQKLIFEIQSYERRSKDRPTEMSLRFDLGKRYYIAGPAFLDKALTEFQLAVKDPKRKLDSHISMGKCFQKKGMYDLADTQYQKAEESGFVIPEKQLDIWYNRAICNVEAGKPDKAIEFGKRILEEKIGYRDVGALVEKWSKEISASGAAS